MTDFVELAQYGTPKQQLATFEVRGIEYEVHFTEIQDVNRGYDSAVEFPRKFVFPQYARHYDVTFDAKLNRINKTYFERVKALPPGGGLIVLNSVVRIIFDHYTRYHVGLYTYAPADFKLSSVYSRLISKPRFTGFSIEVGLEPLGRAHVLRTPQFYD